MKKRIANKVLKSLFDIEVNSNGKIKKLKHKRTTTMRAWHIASNRFRLTSEYALNLAAQIRGKVKTIKTTITGMQNFVVHITQKEVK